MAVFKIFLCLKNKTATLFLFLDQNSKNSLSEMSLMRLIRIKRKNIRQETFLHWVYICRIEWLSLHMLISYWYQYYRCGIHLKRKTALLPLGLLLLVWRHLCCPLFRCHFIDFIKNELSRPLTNLLEKFSYRRVQETVTNSFLNFESSRVQLSSISRSRGCFGAPAILSTTTTGRVGSPPRP